MSVAFAALIPMKLLALAIFANLLTIIPQSDLLIIITVTGYLSQSAVTTVAGDLFARILAQDGFPPFVNAIIAYGLLVIFAAAQGYTTFAGLHYAGGFAAYMALFATAATLLIAGGLRSIKPYLRGLAWVQSHLFSIVPAVLAQPTVDPQLTQPRLSAVPKQPTQPTAVMTATRVTSAYPGPQPIALPSWSNNTATDSALPTDTSGHEG